MHRDPTVLHKLGRTERQEQRCQTAHPEENLGHRSHYPYTFIGHPPGTAILQSNPTRSLPTPGAPRPKTGQESTPIGHALGNGLVQPSFRSPSRRSPSDCSPSHFRRVAGLKLLCIMFYSGGVVEWQPNCEFPNYLAPFFPCYLAQRIE